MSSSSVGSLRVSVVESKLPSRGKQSGAKASASRPGGPVPLSEHGGNVDNTSGLDGDGRMRDRPRSTSASLQTSQGEGTAFKKPAFSTLQQHFTPRKMQRLRPDSQPSQFSGKQPGKESAPRESTLLQIELLQLQMLSSSFGSNQDAWAQSVKDRCRRRFEDVACSQLELEIAEQGAQEKLNFYGLHEWDCADATVCLEDRARILGPLIMDLISLTTPQGQFANVQTEFESWVAWTTDIWSLGGRPGRTDEPPTELRMVEDLGDGWTAAVDALSRRLFTHKRGLDSVGDALHGTSLSAVIGSCRAMVVGLLEELDLMRAVRTDIVRCEKGRVDTMVGSIAAEVNDGVNGLHAPTRARRDVQRTS
ncbi:MAG: hypothetical protein M1832_002210 [Thelocarpon impressellum]|nr:MAG: hypothetical protein M1832_002210 [Thelocarpon impressellum]